MIKNLAYIGFRSPNAEEWRTFGPEVLGAELAPDGPDGAVRLRVDDAAHRIAIHPGERNELAYLGWEVDDLDDDRRARSTPPASPWTTAPSSTPSASGTSSSPRSSTGRRSRRAARCPGFVTGEQGLGHVVLIVPDLAAAEAFYTDVLGFRLSDSVEAGLSLRFLHCAGHAARHHTVALASVPGHGRHAPPHARGDGRSTTSAPRSTSSTSASSRWR